jgi:hypothetical protein
MNARVIHLPTAPRDYIRVRRSGRRWAIDLVTPCPGLRPISTTLARAKTREAAVAYAIETSERMKRPVKLPRGGEP